eukprot:TRINITY_DN76709_c0_g1_i2.p1 TRINITY_DN76709_c0_g1~~TRINITY_DN76709_c0_g1_i2.p1  ORF type:complete len:136 (-),score=18.76 TRINITY_DN76709_c0_g1_i2:35-442(-)
MTILFLALLCQCASGMVDLATPSELTDSLKSSAIAADTSQGTAASRTIAEQNEAFRAWIVEQGEVPEELHSLVPPLELGVDGEWSWNRMLDNPNYNGVTCRPINHFVWKWSGEEVTVRNEISTQAGDSVETIVLK